MHFKYTLRILNILVFVCLFVFMLLITSQIQEYELAIYIYM